MQASMNAPFKIHNSTVVLTGGLGQLGRQFSRALNPQLREQDFSAEQLMDQFSSGLIQLGGGNQLVHQ